MNTDEHLFTICEFIDNEFYSNLESILVQLGPRECVLDGSSNSEEKCKIETILKRSNILCTPQKKGESKQDEIMQDLDRLLNFEEGKYFNTSISHMI